MIDEKPASVNNKNSKNSRTVGEISVRTVGEIFPAPIIGLGEAG